MSSDPALREVESGRDLAAEINALVKRDKGVADFAAPFVHTGYNSTSYIYTSKNIGAGGNVANWRTSANATLLQANDTGVTIGVGLDLPFLTQGSIPIIGTTGALTEDHTGLFYDLANHRLGIGSAGATAPLSTLDINHMFMVTGTDGALVGRGNVDIGPTTAQTGLHVNVSAGRVGVNVSAPSVALDVAGAANVSDVVRARGNVGASMTGAGVELQYNGATLGGVLAYNRSSTTYLDMDVAGKVVTLSPLGSPKVTVNTTGMGVGTVPQSLLEVAGKCRSTDVSGGATTGTGIEMYYVPGGAAGVVRVYDAASTSYLQLILAGNPVLVGLTTVQQVGFYGGVSGTGVTQQSIGTTATTSSAALTRLNTLCDVLINTGLVKS